MGREGVEERDREAGDTLADESSERKFKLAK
jgi:hypothetical protein